MQFMRLDKICDLLRITFGHLRNVSSFNFSDAKDYGGKIHKLHKASIYLRCQG